MMKNKYIQIQYWIIDWILNKMRWIFQGMYNLYMYTCTIMYIILYNNDTIQVQMSRNIYFEVKYYCSVWYIILYINYYCAYALYYTLQLYVFYYLLGFALDFGGFYQKWICDTVQLYILSKSDQKNVLDCHWFLYWIIGGFLLKKSLL